MPARHAHARVQREYFSLHLEEEEDFHAVLLSVAKRKFSILSHPHERTLLPSSRANSGQKGGKYDCFAASAMK